MTVVCHTLLRLAPSPPTAVHAHGINDGIDLLPHSTGYNADDKEEIKVTAGNENSNTDVIISCCYNGTSSPPRDAHEDDEISPPRDAHDDEISPPRDAHEDDEISLQLSPTNNDHATFKPKSEINCVCHSSSACSVIHPTFISPSSSPNLGGTEPDQTYPKGKVFAVGSGSDDEAAKGTSTFRQATLNCLSLLFGLGILSSPYAVAHAGWTGVVIAITIAATYAYTSYLTIRCLDCHLECSTYQHIARRAVGRKSRLLITAIFYMEIAGTVMGYCISVGDNLLYLFPDSTLRLPGLSGRNFMIFAACICVLPTVWVRDITALSLTSMWCVASTIVLLIVVTLSATLIEHIGFRHSIPLVAVRGIPVAAGLYAFSYGGTGVFPSIYKSMKDPSEFPQVMLLSFTIATASICGLGIAGASMFGSQTASQITLSMPSHFITTKVMLWMTVLTPMLKFALLLSPITTALELQLRRRCKVSSPTVMSGMVILMRSGVVGLVAIAAMMLPYFNCVVALIGSSMTISICLIFPCVFYIRLCRSILTRRTLALIFTVGALGAIAGVCGTLFSFRGLIESKKSHI